jgi:hypothetical protein
VPLLKKKPRSFDLRVDDSLLRVTAPEEYYEESRAAALSFAEQIRAYAIRNPKFRTSKRPLSVPEDAPEIVREMAQAARAAGVGPVFTFQGAMTDQVGRFLARSLPEVMVWNAGDYFVLQKRKTKLPVYRDAEGGGLSMVVGSGLGTCGLYTSLGRRQLPAESVDGLAVLATSCILADAAAAAVMAILSRPRSFRSALSYLQGLDGVHGGLVVKGGRIGVVGAVEFAAS